MPLRRLAEQWRGQRVTALGLVVGSSFVVAACLSAVVRARPMLLLGLAASVAVYALNSVRRHEIREYTWITNVLLCGFSIAAWVLSVIVGRLVRTSVRGHLDREGRGRRRRGDGR